MHSEEFHKLYSSPSVVWMVMSKRMRWAGHVTCMGKVRNVYKILDEKPEGNHLEDLGIDGMWTGFFQLRIGTGDGLL
jgi:hypothetical protein